MSGFRGIFLDAMNPLIAKRLDADTNAFRYRNSAPNKTDIFNNSFDQQDAAWRYFQERTPWIRVAPFAIPQTTFLANPHHKILNMPTVPDWRDWVIWGGKAIDHGNTTEDILQGTGTPYMNTYSHKVAGLKSSNSSVDGIYRGYNTGWKGSPAVGVLSNPIPGITELSVSNKGDLGTIRRASFRIKVYNLDDLEAIEMMYMVPGMSVLVEWGWFHPTKYIDPIDLELIQNGQALSNTNLINTEILRKSFGVENGDVGDPTPLYNLEAQAQQSSDGILGPDAGLYDGMLGVVTKFNWSNDGAGGYDCAVDIISPGSLATGIPAVSYETGGAIEVDGKPILVSDVRTILATIKQESRGLERAPVEANADKSSANNIAGIELGDPAGEQEVTVQGSNEGTTVSINPRSLSTSTYGISITKGADGELSFNESSNQDSGGSEYFVGEYAGGKRQRIERIYGDRTWWNRCIAYSLHQDELAEKAANFGHDLDLVRKGLYNMKQYLIEEGSSIMSRDLDDLDEFLDNGRVSDFLRSGGYNDRGLANMEVQWGDALRKGDFYIKEGNCSSTPEGARNLTRRGNGYQMWIIINGTPTEYITDDNNVYINSRNYFFPWDTPSLIPYMEKPGQEDLLDANGNLTKVPERASSINKIKGAQTKPDKAASKYGWTPAGDGKSNYVDESGQDVDWAEGNIYAVTPEEGVTVYEKDENGNYKEVASFTGPNALTAEELKAKIVAKAKGIDTANREAREENYNEQLRIDAEITATAKNFGMLSWVNGEDFARNGLKPFKYSTSGKYHKAIYSKAHPIFAPPITQASNGTGKLVSGELQHDFQEGSEENLFPVGVVAYSNTYVSWRFVEDYIINELYMPKSVKPGEEGNNDGSISLENLFRSCHRMTDEEKYSLSDTVLEKHGLKKEDNKLTQESLDFELWKPVQIVNHSGLRSMDPDICILPGQEGLSGIVAFEIDGGSSANYLLDDNLKGASKFIKKDTALNKFAGLNESGERSKQRHESGILRNILINTDLLMETAEKATDVRKFCLTILDKVNEACGKPWSFKILTNSALGTISVIDENYTGKKPLDDYDAGWTNTKDGIYYFSGIGLDNILQDVKIQSKIPSELQTMAYYASSGAANDKGSAIQMFQMYGAGISDRLKSISSIKILGNETGSEESRKEAEKALLEGYVSLLGSSRRMVLEGSDNRDPMEEGMSTAEQYVKKYIHGNTVDSLSYRPPIPIDVSMTLHGVSGIYMGNAIHLKTADDGGILPNRYKQGVALQVTSVDHTVNAETWNTSIGTLMRPMNDSDRKPDVGEIKVVESPYEEEQVFDGNNGPKSSKSLDALHPTVRAAWLRVEEKLKNAGWQPSIVTAFRSLEEQAEKARGGRSKVILGFHGTVDENLNPASQALDVIDKRYSYGNHPKSIANIGKKATKDKAFKFWADLGKFAYQEGFTRWGGDYNWKGNPYKKNGDYDPNASKVNKKNKPSETHIGWDPGHIEWIGNGLLGHGDFEAKMSKYYGRRLYKSAGKPKDPNRNLV